MLQLLKKLMFGVVLFVVTLAVIAGSSYMILKDNYHRVWDDSFYRSAQLDPSRLQQVIEADKIKTIVNLRGYNPDEPWYKQEVAMARKYGVKHIDIALSSQHLPAPSTFRHLVSVLQDAPKPILIHCESGSDRTGLASAIVLLLHDQSIKKANRQIEWYYGVFAKNSIGHLILPRYQEWLADHDWQSNKQHFLQWTKKVNWD